MGKKRRNRSALKAMETEEATKSSGPWLSGVKMSEGGDTDQAAGASAMDTSEGLPLRQPTEPGLRHLGTKNKAIAKRGNRTRNQRKRKGMKLAKALAVVDRRATSKHKAGLQNQQKKDAKTLWRTKEPVQMQ